MTDSAAEQERTIVAATRPATLLNELADGVRADLVKLRGDLANVQRDLDGQRIAELLAANEQLVLAALHADTVAETASRNLIALTRASQRDALTDTPNRVLMLDRLDIAIPPQRHGTRTPCLFLDSINSGNQRYARSRVGDEVVAARRTPTESVVRDSDTVSRYGGDEFLVLLSISPRHRTLLPLRQDACRGR